MIPKIPAIHSSTPEFQELMRWCQQVQEMLNGLLPVTGGAGLISHQIPGAGTVVGLDDHGSIPIKQLAIIKSTGPSGEADFTDNRHWVKLCYLKQTDSDTNTTAANPVEEDGTRFVTFMATNVTSTTHDYKAGDIVEVISWYGRGRTSSPIEQSVIVNASPFVLVKIVSSTGDAWTGCTYTVQDKAGTSYTAYNAMEPCEGSPGPLGVNVSSSNGTVNSGTCVVKPIGPTTRYFPMWKDPNSGNWTFCIPNSAQ